MTNKIPKTRQIYFFLMPAEAEKFHVFLKKIDFGIFLTKYSSKEISDHKIHTLQDNVYLCPATFEREIKLVKIDDSAYYIEPSTSPILELNLSVLRGRDLSSGRIVFRRGYEGRNGRVEFPDQLFEYFCMLTAFLKDQIFSKVKEKGAYLSKETVDFLASGGRLNFI